MPSSASSSRPSAALFDRLSHVSRCVSGVVCVFLACFLESEAACVSMRRSVSPSGDSSDGFISDRSRRRSCANWASVLAVALRGGSAWPASDSAARFSTLSAPSWASGCVSALAWLSVWASASGRFGARRSCGRRGGRAPGCIVVADPRVGQKKSAGLHTLPRQGVLRRGLYFLVLVGERIDGLLLGDRDAAVPCIDGAVLVVDRYTFCARLFVDFAIRRAPACLANGAQAVSVWRPTRSAARPARRSPVQTRPSAC